MQSGKWLLMAVIGHTYLHMYIHEEGYYLQTACLQSKQFPVIMPHNVSSCTYTYTPLGPVKW